MRPEIDFAGVYLSALVPTLIAALLGTALLRKPLARLGVYRLVWHPALFETALFIILWAAVVGLTTKV